MSNPLVSVVIVSYNASRTIVETLDSIKAQTYSPLELIIADDHSMDDTANKCVEWLAENHSRFVNSRLIVNERNLGVSANINVGIRASSGEWIKGLGDDVLLPDAIEKNINFAKKHNSDIVVSRVQPFVDKTREQLNIFPSGDYLFPVSNHDQYIALIRGKLICPSPTWFFSRELYNGVGGYSERYRLSDDMPFIFKVLKSGYVLPYLPEVTVLYRITQNSLSKGKKTGKQKQPFFESRSKFYYELIVPELKKNKLWGVLIRKNLFYFFYERKIFSRDNSIKRYLYGALWTIVSWFETW